MNYAEDVLNSDFATALREAASVAAHGRVIIGERAFSREEVELIADFLDGGE